MKHGAVNPFDLLIENPRLKTFEALRQLTIWPLVDLAIDDDDDDEDA
jgi:hypothetical protein